MLKMNQPQKFQKLNIPILFQRKHSWQGGESVNEKPTTFQVFKGDILEGIVGLICDDEVQDYTNAPY